MLLLFLFYFFFALSLSKQKSKRTVSVGCVLYSDKAHHYSQSERALYPSFIIKRNKAWIDGRVVYRDQTLIFSLYTSCLVPRVTLFLAAKMTFPCSLALRARFRLIEAETPSVCGGLLLGVADTDDVK